MPIKNVIGVTFEDFGEEIVKSLVAEFDYKIETGIQTTTHTQKINIANEKKKEEEKMRKIAERRWRLDQQNKLAEKQKRIREEAKMKQFQQDQADAQEQQVKKIEVIKKKENIA